jgi:uncharacterized membrane protein
MDANIEAAAATESGGTVFRAELRPHRSASVAAVNRLILLLLVIFVPTAIGFVLAGAWPVTGFMGFELILLYACFRINLLRGAAVELIDLSRERLRIERVNHWGGRQVWTLKPQWTRVELTAMSPTRGRLTLRSRGLALSIGGFLTLDEQGELARALEDAVLKAQAADFSAVKPA